MVQRVLSFMATVAAAMVLSVGAPPAMGEANLLDGKSFRGEVGEKGKPADERNEVIIFQAGEFHSSACDKWGFGKATYSASVSGDAIQFETETKSDEHGRLVWRGVAKGDTLEGTFMHYRKPSFFRPSPDPIEHWFKASLKN